jgi:CBS domain-containing protein
LAGHAPGGVTWDHEWHRLKIPDLGQTRIIKTRCRGSRRFTNRSRADRPRYPERHGSEQKEERTMKVSEKMTRNVHLVSPDDTIQQAARIMSEHDTGVLPVSQDDRLIGMITDRDIALRGVAQGKGVDTKVREVMTPDVKYCFGDEDLEHVACNMGWQQVRRLPVMNRDKRLVGILSLGDMVVGENPHLAGAAMAGISRPGGPHSQTGGARTGD